MQEEERKWEKEKVQKKNGWTKVKRMSERKEYGGKRIRKMRGGRKIEERRGERNNWFKRWKEKV